ncbi:molybdate ABC transporter substrate-binding protein [Marinilabilia sp.]|uniref:molybdate ABC transporter substrate-binding protein n=1 Tax=Marinilabilia sp. TaxID=2021252 RepID=UPI0025BDB64C|nr:molybdate ABC transporter substrate-binding protein [Marinilabilia sp.]
MKHLNYLIIVTLLILLHSCNKSQQRQAPGKTEKLTLLVAASLTDVITVLADSAEKDLGVELKLNLSSSGTLARQITEQIPCDIYISASKRWMDYVDEKGFTIPESRCIPAQNKLVLIAPKDKNLQKPFKLINLASLLDSRLSIGDPTHVPAGKYAVEALHSLKIYHSLSDRILPAKDVRSALMIVELGEANFGIVYKTDAVRSTRVNIVAIFPDSTHQPINYHAAVLKSSQKKNTAKKVLDYFTSEQSKKVWAGYGFTIVEKAPPR